MSTVHACPLGGGEFTRCCNREVTELAQDDRVTSVIDNVTCLELLLKESRVPEIVPVPAVVPSVSEPGEDAGFEVMRADAVAAGRAMSSAEFLAGLIAAAELDTVGSPRKLPMDVFPDLDPVDVQRVWERALVVGVRAGRLMGAPRFHRDQLARLRGELAEAGFHAMGGLVGRSLSAVERAPDSVHPADGEDVRGH